MSAAELYRAYLLWLRGGAPRGPRRLFDFPAGDRDVFENERFVVNRLFFLIPHDFGGKMRCFFFFEENVFRKDRRGDLTLVRSSLHLPRCARGGGRYIFRNRLPFSYK